MDDSYSDTDTAFMDSPEGLVAQVSLPGLPHAVELCFWITACWPTWIDFAETCLWEKIACGDFSAELAVEAKARNRWAISL